jgi:hypothetical protein
MRLAGALVGTAAICVAACSRSSILDEVPTSSPASSSSGSGAAEPSCVEAGGTICAGRCVQLASDDANCGACGHACAPGGGCVDGVCASPRCPAGLAPCGSRCVDLANDPASCGACGASCPGWDGCNGGQCIPACPFAVRRTQVSSNTKFEPGRIAAGDVDGDGHPDLAVAGFYGTPDQQTLGELDVLLNRGGGSFVGPAPSSIPLPENTCGLALAPFGGPGSDDVAACTYDAPTQIFRDQGAGAFAPVATLPGAVLPLAMAVADFDGDGRPDVALIEQDDGCCGGASGALDTFLNRGGGTFSTASLAEDSTPGQETALLAGDLDGDGHADLVGLLGTPALRAYLGHGDGSFTARPTMTLPNAPRGGALGDVDADGRIDLVLTMDGGSARIYRGDGAGGFAPGATLAAGPQSMGAAIADFDGDGRADVAIADYDSGSIAVFPALGGGAFGAPSLCAAGYAPQGFTSADLDGDGAPDLASVDYDGTVNVLLYRGRRP